MKNIPIIGKFGAILAVFGMVSVAAVVASTCQMKFLTASYIALRNDQTAALQQLIRSHVDIEFIRGAAGHLMAASDAAVRQQELSSINNYRKRFSIFMGFAEKAEPAEAPAIAAVKSNVLQFTAGLCIDPAALRAAAGSNAPTLPAAFAERCVPQFTALSNSIQSIIDRTRSADIRAGAKLERMTRHVIATTFYLILGALALVMFGGFFAVRAWIAKPIDGLRRTMGELAGGALQARVSGTERRDEIGGMARAVQVFKDAGLKKQQLEEEARGAAAELAARTSELEAAQRLAKSVSWRWDIQSRSIQFSRAFWGATSLLPAGAPVTYEQIKLLHHPDDAQDALAAYNTALRTKEPVTLECRMVRPDGEICHVLTHVEPIVEPDGRVTQLRGTSQDITTYRNIEAALRDSEDHYRHMVELHPQIPWTAGPDGGLLEVGPKWFQLTGMTREETLPFGWITAVHPDDRLHVITLSQECVASGRPLDTEFRMKLPDGRILWFRSRAAARVDHHGRIVRWYGTLEDVTDWHMAEAARRASEALAFRVLEATTDAVIVFDRSGHVKYANAQAISLFSSGAPLTNLSVAEIFATRSTAHLAQALDRGVEAGESSNSTFFCPRLNIWAEANIYADAENVSLFVRDISDKKHAEEQLSYAACHDSLTGTLNRGEFFARLKDVIAQQAPGRHTALFCLDVDDFKDINDVHGHPVGDGLLQQIVARLSALLRPHDLLARSGGDEFMLAQTGIATEAEAERLAEDVLHAMRGGFIINGLVIAASMSVGVAMTTPDVTDGEAVYKRADIALYQSKTHAKGNFRCFHSDMQEKFDRAHRLRFDLATALEDKELYLEFQPIIRTQDGEIVGAEALLRWRHPIHGLIPPAEFIPIAEDSGLICEIGAWMLDQACHAAQGWPAKIGVSVNVSPRQFELGDIVQTVADALHRSGLAPERLKLEITESVFISKESGNLHMMSELQKLGLSLVLDDFGTGYSSLSYLDTFRFDLVKIDRSFIAKSTNSETQPLLEAIIGITSALKLPVTAEGVETPEQLEHVRKLGCHYVQGYLFGKPGTETEFSQRLQALELATFPV
ncbi:MAG TPA: EAL domain-containing protein [Acidocella sp.]|nr:EAL domain-containing protein [Acidocella sp.]